MHMPVPVSPAAAASVSIPPSTGEGQSRSSSSSSSFVSWCESQHGSLPTTHQRLLHTAKQGRGTDAGPIAPTSAPPATKVGLQTSVGILQQFYESDRKGRQAVKVETAPKAAKAIVTDDEGDNNGDDDSDSSSYDNEDDELDEGEDNNDSFTSSDESVPAVVEIPGTAGQDDEDLSSICDLSLAEMMLEEEEVELDEVEEGGGEEYIADYGPGGKAIAKDGVFRDIWVPEKRSKTALKHHGKDNKAEANTNKGEEDPTKKVIRFDLPSPTNQAKKKGVSFSDTGADDKGKAKGHNELPVTKSRSNKQSSDGESGKKKRRRSRYVSSASSTRAVIQSFMSHTRASMAKTRRSLSKGNKSVTTKACSTIRTAGSKPSGTNNKAKRDDTAAASVESTDVNVTDAVARAKQRIRQHRQKVRNQGAF